MEKLLLSQAAIVRLTGGTHKPLTAEFLCYDNSGGRPSDPHAPVFLNRNDNFILLQLPGIPIGISPYSAFFAISERGRMLPPVADGNGYQGYIQSGAATIR